MDPMSGFVSVLCLHYRHVTVHCSTKDAYTSEITFLALNPSTVSSVYFSLLDKVTKYFQNKILVLSIFSIEN